MHRGRAVEHFVAIFDCLFEEALHCNARWNATFRGDPEGAIHLRLERLGTRHSAGVLRTVSASSRR